MHQTRNEVPRTWPIARKGTKYIVVASHNKKEGIPLLFVLRDMLKVVKNRKELKKVLHERKIKVNGKKIREEKYALTLFDIIELGEKSYKLILKNKKFMLQETKDKEKTVKVIGKKALKGNILQINLSDGRNLVSKEKLRVGDSLVLNFEGKIIKKLELKENAKIIVTGGSHLGEEGKIEKLEKNKAIISIEKEEINLDLKKIMAI